MSSTDNVLRAAVLRAIAILLGSFGGRRHSQARAAGDARRILQAGMRGETAPQTDTELSGEIRPDRNEYAAPL